MVVIYRFLGEGKTDANGVAHMTKDAQGNTIDPPGLVGTGAGELDVVASLDNPIGSGSVVSQPTRVFDCPVYDGDNTPTSISWSKTNNAVVTDEVVSLIASVLNTNNNPCINIPVVFKQGNTVLGTAYTDCSGDATITYTWADSDIFNVTAQVGQSLSEDLTMFVKDKDINYLFYDIGVQSNHTDWYDNNLPTTQFERLSDCTFLKNYTGTNKNRFQVTDNLTASHIIIKYDLHPIGNNTNDYTFIQFSDQQNAINMGNWGSSDYVTHIKLELNGQSANIQQTINGTTSNIVTNYPLKYDISTHSFNLRFGFNANSDGIKVSNIIIYEL